MSNIRTQGERAVAPPTAVEDGAARPQPTEAALSGPQWWMLAAVMIGTFMSMLDDFIVNVATPAIRRDLSASFAEIQLVISGYVLIYGLLLVTGGRLGDMYGPKRLFLLGVGVFTVASLACGLAPTPLLLIIFRVVEAGGAALFYPQVLSVLNLSFTGRPRALAFAVFGATIGLASIAGQLVGGALVSANLFGLSWRPIFMINVPLGLVALGVAARTLPGSRAPTRPRLDLVGVTLATAALALLTLPLIAGRELGWPRWIIAMLVLAGPALALFLWWEQRLAGHGHLPLVPPALFRIRTFRAGSAIAVVFFAGNSGLFFLLPLQLQFGLGFSALASGLTFTPLAIAFALGSLLAARLHPRLGTRVLTLGYGINVVGNVALLVTAVAVGQTMTGLVLAPSLAIIGLGEGLGMSPLVGAALAGVPDQEAGTASGVLETMMQIGLSFGVTVIGLIFFILLGPHATTAAAYTHAFIGALIAQPVLAVLTLLLVPTLTSPTRQRERTTP